MPKLAHNYYYYTEYQKSEHYTDNIYKFRQKKIVKPPKKRKKSVFRLILSSLIILFLMSFVFIKGFNYVIKSVFTPTPYKSVNVDFKEFAYPLNNYLSNSLFLGQKSFKMAADEKNAQMIKLKENVNMPALKNELLYLMEQYPQIKPSIYVWDFETQNFVDINASKVYATASIIKIPILIDLFKSIENGQLTLDETMPLTEYFRTEGSGSLQFKAANSNWTIDKLAEIMITESDNSATNMIMSKIGSMTEVNSSIRNWGLKNTEIRNWLPDLAGTNKTTAKELAQMLYNIDSNEKFLSEYSRSKIFNYMSKVHNNRLIHAGLGKGSVFLHKTGDIGKMLGDAGIVIAPDGTKYIVVILAQRPHNSFAGKEFIVKASEIIYRYMVR